MRRTRRRVIFRSWLELFWRKAANNLDFMRISWTKSARCSKISLLSGIGQQFVLPEKRLQMI